MASIDATYAKQYEEFYIGLEGSFGSKHVSPRTLTSCFLSCVVCVEGIVTKCEWVNVGGKGNGGGTEKAAEAEESWLASGFRKLEPCHYSVRRRAPRVRSG